MKILFLNAFHGGSHAAVAEGYIRHSKHQIELIKLPIDGGWRWRMRGATVTFARMLREGYGQQTLPFDLIICTDMLDLATFRGLMGRQLGNIPIAVYFHENQLTYPIPAGRKLDLTFPWINYTTCLAADAIFYNSAFHRRVWIEALPGLIGRYHDFKELEMIDAIAAKSHVLHPGVDLARLADGQRPERSADHVPIILWNSRWEYDKNPSSFFAALESLEEQGYDFRLIVLGEHIDPNEPSFAAARQRFGSRALSWGYAPDTASYRDALWQADIVVSAAIQEFFGISVIEAIACGCVPILPQRLSYPEIIPQQFHADCLYSSQDDFVAKLAQALTSLPRLQRLGLATIAAQYDWQIIVEHYDRAFEEVAS